MKVIVSSSLLAEELKKLDLDNDSVQYLEFTLKAITFVSKNTSINLLCYISGPPVNMQRLTQFDVGWKHVRDLVSKVQDQPIVLRINQNSVSVIFQY